MSTAVIAQGREASVECVRPNFIIVGGAKCGTTSLYEYLRQHPDVYMHPKTKEPHYFVTKTGAGNLTDYSPEEYFALFAKGVGKKAIGEASTGYLPAPESPAWIREVLGPIKIVILLRNPAKRAYSMWGELVREGMESIATFEEALAAEEARQTDPEFARTCLQLPLDYAYFANGLYSEMVKRYLDTFGRERVFVGLFEDLAKDPLAFCRDVFRFLEIDENFRPAIDVHNAGRIPRSIAMQHWMERILLGREDRSIKTRALWLMLRTLPRDLRGQTLMTIRRWNVRLGYSPSLSASLYADLMERYRPDVERLEQILGRSLHVWLR